MQVDFYLLGQTPVEVALPLLARATLASGEKLLIVSADLTQRERIGRGLWELKGSFLAHGESGGQHDARQPILLSADLQAVGNAARFIALADGQWRDGALGFDRAMLVFGESAVAAAREVWRSLDGRDDIDRRFFQQEDGKWRQAA